MREAGAEIPAAVHARVIVSSAISRYVVHFPPATVTSPRGETRMRCSRRSVAVASHPIAGGWRELAQGETVAVDERLMPHLLT